MTTPRFVRFENLNPNAWVDAPPGQFGKTAPYLNDYRWQRQPAESVSLGRNFFVNRERNVKFEVRAEFYNVFNRLFLTSPEPIKLSGTAGILTGANPAAPPTRDQQGQLTSGYGYVNWINGAGSQPRAGQVVARVTF